MPREALGPSQGGTRLLYSSKGPSPPLPTAQPSTPPLPQRGSCGERCSGHCRVLRGSACGLSASLQPGEQTASRQPGEGGGGGGRRPGALASSFECKALPSTGLSAVLWPLLPRAVCRAAAGNRGGQGAQNRRHSLGFWEGWRPAGKRGQPGSQGGAQGVREAAPCILAPHPLSFLPDSLLPGFLRPQGRRSPFNSFPW